jgi:hypothetical protein
MAIERLTVFLPCHTFDDFPTWLDEAEADDLLAAWTAAWEPCLLAAVGDVPGTASIDLAPPDDRPLLGIVPAAFADRFSGPSVGGGGGMDSRFVERVSGRVAITAAAARAVGIENDAAGALPGSAWSADFRALGLAVLLVELLTRRMRSTPELADTGFGAAAVAAAHAALAGDAAAVRERLRECYGSLEGCRARYYPVDIWLLDLVLVATASSPAAIAAALEAPVPIGLVTDADLPGALATRAPDLLERLRSRVTEGRAEVLGGRRGTLPLDLVTPEEVADSFTAGLDAWRAAGIEPTVFARYSGNATPLLPQVLAGCGFAGMVWPLFDGTPLPDPHAGRIRWEGGGGAVIEAVARPPLDARRAVTIVGLAERLGDALDHDHVASLTFAHFAGTAGEWHELLRRIGSWSTVLGTFITPAEFFRATAHGGSLARFDADAFAVTLPEIAPPGGDVVGEAVARAAATARDLRDRARSLEPCLAAPPARPAPPLPRVEAAGAKRGLWPWRQGGPAEPTLDNGSLRVALHTSTGGILSVRRPSDRGNRLSQQLAVRQPGRGPAPPRYSRMIADVIERGTTACGADGLVVRGRLLDEGDGLVGQFTQGVSLVGGEPVAVIDVEIALARPLAGPPLECLAACRFAWNENDDLQIRRSLHTQSVATDREVFTAPHFIELRPAGIRGDQSDAVTILTGGLPWHMLASPHVLDAVLVAGGGAHATTPAVVSRRLAVGVGMAGTAAAALALMAGDPPVAAGQPIARLTVDAVEQVDGRPVRARIGLLETAGRSGDVRVEWAVEPRQAAVCDLRGRPRGTGDTPTAHVAIDGRPTVEFLRAHEGLHVEVEFPT